MPKSFKEYFDGMSYVGGVRLGNPADNITPIASLGDVPPKDQGGKDSRGVGLHANYSTQAPGTMRPFLTANTEKKKVEMMKLIRKAMSTMPGSQKQKDIKKQINVLRKDLGLDQIKENTFDKIKVTTSRWFKQLVDKVRRIATTSKRYEYAAKVLQDVIDRKKRERYPQPLRHDIGYYASVVADTFHDIDSKKLQSMVHEDANRIPRKKGQPAGSDKHSDLYTDENPKGTIHGLGFTDAETARKSVSKIKNSGKTHAHKIQAAIAMSQRAKVASQRAKDPQRKKDLGQAHKIYQEFIDKNKKSK